MPQIKSSSEGRTMVLTLSNPEHGNALGPEMYAAGVEALIAADSNPEVRSVVITGEGATFSVGGNLHQLLQTRQRERQAQAERIEGLHSWIEAIRSFPKPVIAAVEGAAAGAGFSLALACDFIVAAENATFLMAHGNAALSPDGGATWSLAQALPRQLINQLLMAGERIDAKRLQQLGLVNQVAAPGAALAEALVLAQELNQKAPNALASIKELINDAPGSSLNRQLAAERDHFINNLNHENAAVGIAAFLGKHSPEYS